MQKTKAREFWFYIIFESKSLFLFWRKEEEKKLKRKEENSIIELAFLTVQVER